MFIVYCVKNRFSAFSRIPTLKSPPFPSSNSNTYPSTYDEAGGCHAIVTLLFSALHSSVMISAALGAKIIEQNKYFRGVIIFQTPTTELE